MALPRWQSTFTDEAGDVRAGLSVEIRDESSGALAALFSDRAGTSPKSNPAQTDANGYLFFYVAPGRYRIQATDVDWRDVEVTQQEDIAQNATDIAQKADLAGGADANFVLMPQVGGDPIVESVSNAAGEFTKWADGTQECSIADLSFSFSGTAVENTTWTYPSAFVSAPSSVVGQNNSSTRYFLASNDGGTATSIDLVLRHHLDSTATATHTASVNAYGSWK